MITALKDKHQSSTRAAFAALAARCEADLLRVARRLCRGNEDKAQDFVQDALVRAYVAYREGKFDMNASFPETRGYLLRTVTNLFINDYRRHLKWDAGTDVDTLTAGGETGPEQTRARAADIPGYQLEGSALDEPLETALAVLSDASRLVVMLVDVEERTYEEAARLLEVPIGTVRSRLARARQQLRELLYTYAIERRLIP